MKKLIFILTLMFNMAVGFTLAELHGLPPLAVALSLGLAGFLVPMPSQAFMAGIFAEVWTGEMVKAFRNSMENIGWLQRIKAYDQYAENDVIHFVNLGGDPGVLINNTTYPIEVQSLEDADKAISLDKYQTKATRITDDELHAITYDKMASVIERHRESIDQAKYSRALHAIAPAGHSAVTPVLLTTGAASTDGLRKTLTRADLIAMKQAFDKLKVPTQGRIMVLCPDHVADLLQTDQKFADQYYNYASGRIANMYGFEVYEFADAPYFAQDKSKLPYGAVPATGNFMASVVFYAPRMMRATGSTKAYLSDAASNPTTQENLINFRHYFIALPLKNEAIGAIVSAAV
ncbi:MAG: hypothetical protein IPM52_13255 [Bacteroidetes bacterium]|nr:hypothetical protein [Bacteroidota bacterium]